MLDQMKAFFWVGSLYQSLVVQIKLVNPEERKPQCDANGRSSDSWTVGRLSCQNGKLMAGQLDSWRRGRCTDWKVARAVFKVMAEADRVEGWHWGTRDGCRREIGSLRGMEMLWTVTKPLGPQVSDTPDLEIVSLTTTEDSWCWDLHRANH